MNPMAGIGLIRSQELPLDAETQVLGQPLLISQAISTDWLGSRAVRTWAGIHMGLPWAKALRATPQCPPRWWQTVSPIVPVLLSPFIGPFNMSKSFTACVSQGKGGFCGKKLCEQNIN